MNTLKPLLIVAVLAGIGYGVYIRLNRGKNGPPPVAEGWDTVPDVQLPDSASGAPWSPPSAEAQGSPPIGLPPTAAAPAPDGGQAPGFNQPPSATMPGQAPPAAVPGQTPEAVGQAPPFGGADGAAEAPPFAAANASGNPASPPIDMPPAGTSASAPPSAGPSEYPPSAPGAEAGAPGTQEAPPVDPYAGTYNSDTPDQRPAPPLDSAPPAGTPAADQGPAVGDPAGAGGSSGFAAAFESAKRQLEGGQMADALRQLSQWYGRGELAPAEQQQLNQLLDQVAGSVVYSTQNLIEAPYEVQPGERLEDIGDKYGVPWQLLAKINGIDDPAALRPGERLKVVRGPFQAVVSLEKRELTLFAADGLYAGRFKIGVGGEHPPREGTFPVAEKVVNPVYYGRDRAISAEDADNPLGERWIGLGGGVGIHGTTNPQNIGRTDLPGSISLSERDVEDVFDILSLGSRVTIRR